MSIIESDYIDYIAVKDGYLYGSSTEIYLKPKIIEKQWLRLKISISMARRLSYV